MSRVIKFQFLYKGLPFSLANNDFNWHKKAYSLNDLMNSSLYELSDIHGSCELVAKRQFIGLTDKNGVEIYDGDIVNMPIDDEWFVIDVSFDVDRGVNGWNVIPQHINDGLEVIGNIHQHKELLDSN